MEYCSVTVWNDNWFNASMSKLLYTFPVSYFIYICAWIKFQAQSFSRALQLPSSVLTVSCDENDNIMNVGFVISIAKAEGCIINPPSLCQARTRIVIGIGDAKFWAYFWQLVLNHQLCEKLGYDFYRDASLLEGLNELQWPSRPKKQETPLSNILLDHS